MSRPVRILAVAAALTLLPAAALAHPGFDPNRVPVGEQVDADLIIAHGCTMAATDADAATVRVDLGYTDQVRVAPVEVDGWDVVDDGEAIVWTDAGGATHDAFRLPIVLTVVHGGEGDQLYLPVLQQCAGGDSYRWVAEPGQDGDPAVRLELTSGVLGTHPIDDDHGHDDGEVPQDEATEDQPETAGPDEADDPSPPHDDDADVAAGDDAAAGMGAGMLVPLLVALVLLATATAVILARRRSKEP